MELGGNAYYAQLSAAGHLGEFLDELKALPILEGAKLREISFSFIGIDLASIPTFQFWKWENPTWSQIGLFLIPVVSAGLQAVSMWFSQKMNNKVATNADGEQDEPAAKTANQTNTTMMLMMPLMSLWIGYSMPAAISIYWIAQAVFRSLPPSAVPRRMKRSVSVRCAANRIPTASPITSARRSSSSRKRKRLPPPPVNTRRRRIPLPRPKRKKRSPFPAMQAVRMPRAARMTRITTAKKRPPQIRIRKPRSNVEYGKIHHRYRQDH